MTKHRNESSGSRQSVFERLGGKSSGKSIVYCSSWLKTGTCPKGKSCKYVGSHINLSGSDSKSTRNPGTSGHHSVTMKTHSKKGGKDRSGGSPEPSLEIWDQTDLEYADEKVLEKRLELLRRELMNAEVKPEHHSAGRSKHHGRSKHKVVNDKAKKRHSSSSSSSSSSGSSSSSQSSSSSSSSEEAQSSGRFKHAKRHSASSSPSPKRKPRSFQKHNKEKRVSPETKVARNPKAFGPKSNYKKGSPVKSRHRTPPKRKASPVKTARNTTAGKKDKGRGYSPPPHKRDRKSHTPPPRRIADKKGNHSPKRARTPPHRGDKRKSSPVRGQRGGNNQRKSPPLRRNIDNRTADRGKQQKNVKGRFDKTKEEIRRSLTDKREDERLREKCRLLREAELKRNAGGERRDSPGEVKKNNRRDVKTRDRERQRHKEPDRLAKGSRDDPPAKQSPQDRRPPPHHSRGVNSARTPAQGRIMDRILERKSYLGDRDKDKDRLDRDRLRDRGLDRVHSEHRSRAGSREQSEYQTVTSGLRGRDETTGRFPSAERMSPNVRQPEGRHSWDNRSLEGDGDWERNKWARGNRRGQDWQRTKDWGPGEWNDGLEWPAGGRGASRAGRGGPDSKRPLKRGELKGGRAGDKDLEEVLSDISDDADEILNRDEEALDSDSTVSDEPDFKISTLICGPMQDPLTQRLLADDFDMDFEDASDEDVDTKVSISDALGVDWASLVQETKPSATTQGETGSAKKRWEPAQVFARLGLSEAMAGRQTVERLKAKYDLDKPADSGEFQELDTAPVLLHSMPGVHSALREKIKARRQLFDPARRALNARHDLSIRKQVCGFPVTLLQQTPVTTAIVT